MKTSSQKLKDKSSERETPKLPLEGVWGTQPSLSGSLRAGALKGSDCKTQLRQPKPKLLRQSTHSRSLTKTIHHPIQRHRPRCLKQQAIARLHQLP